MNWDKPTRYAQVSKCGRYSICAISLGRGHFYESWQTRSHPDGAHRIATNLPSAEEARKLVEAHDAES